jgi:Flp pilus assembly protein TadG
MITAELATALPVLVIVTLAAVAAVAVASDRVRCADGAREAARAVARGDRGLAAALVASAAGAQARLVLTATGPQETTATVTRAVQPLPWLPAVTLTESATVFTEPDVGS